MLDFLRPHKPAETQTPATKATVDLSRFNKVINFCLYALVLLTPLLFSSLTSETREFNKQSFVFLGVAVMLGAWVVKILTTRAVSWVKTSLDYILLAYVGVYLLTSLTSIDKASSFLGYFGRFTGSFIFVVISALFYFLVVNNLKTEHTVKRLINFFTVGSAVTLVYSLLQLFGVYVLPMAFTHDRGFNPIGSLVGLAIFAALNILFIQWRMFAQPVRGKLTTFTWWALTIVSLLIMLTVNAFVAWLVLALAMVSFLALSMATSDKEPQAVWKPMIILVISILFVAFQFLPSVLNPRNLISVDLPVEIQLSNSTAWNLVGNSLSSNVKTALLGSGPGTTGIVFGSIKPTDLNQTIVWNLTFDRAPSEIAGIAIETGIIGLVVFELLSILFLIYGLYFLLKKSTHLGWNYAFGFYILWVGLYLAHFFYFFNTTFSFMYWLSIAVFMAMAHLTQNVEEEHRSISFASSPRSAMSWMFVSLLLLAGLLIGTFFQAAVYGGEVAFARGVKEASRSGADYAKAAGLLNRAFVLNPYRDAYYLTYGQNIILRAREESAKEKPDQDLIRNLLADLITVGQKATQVSPARASNWQALAGFYADIRPLASNADQYIIESLSKAIERDPNNPALHFQLGQAYLAASQTTTPAQGGGQPETKTDPEMIKKAEAELNTSIKLKPDLAEFYIQLARVLETGDRAAEAKTKMAEAAKLFPSNPDVHFEHGRLAYNQKNNDEAEQSFLNAIAINENYANAHYSLGLLYQQKGDKVKALAEFVKTREIVGDKDPNIEALNKLITDLGGK